MLTLLASFAQEESRSVSENCKWRIHHGFEEGKPNTCRMLGYRLIDGEITLIPEEAEGQCGRANGAGDAFSGIQHPDAGHIQGWKGRCQIGGLSA